MAQIELSDLAATSGPIMGLDPGTKTIGIAISDRSRLISTPLETIKRKKFTPDATHLFELYTQRECTALVIGLPLNMDGSSGPRVQSVKDFSINLMNIKNVPFMFWDERLSTAAVTRTMIEGDISRAKRAQAVDKLAASYILQGVLDRLRN